MSNKSIVYGPISQTRTVECFKIDQRIGPDLQEAFGGEPEEREILYTYTLDAVPLDRVPGLRITMESDKPGEMKLGQRFKVTIEPA